MTVFDIYRPYLCVHLKTEMLSIKHTLHEGLADLLSSTDFFRTGISLVYFVHRHGEKK